jgi:hypothetical protein
MLNSYSTRWGPDILPWISLFSSLAVFAVYLLNLQRFLLVLPKSVFHVRVPPS